jgi:outer membrane protein
MSARTFGRTAALATAIAAIDAAALVASAPAVQAQQTPPRPMPSSVVQTTPADSGARPISLDEAVRLARRNAPAAVAARGAIRANNAAVRSGYAAFIPTLSFNAGNNRQGGDRLGPQGNLIPFTGPPWSANTGLNTSLELFDGGRRIYELRQARANVTSAESGEVLQSFRSALEVSQQYFIVLAARESEAAARVQLEQAEQQLRAASARVAAGAATRSDSLRSVIQVGNAQLALLNARNDMRVASAALTRLVGTPYTVTAESSDSANLRLDVPLDSASLLALAERGPAVEQAEAARVAARAGTRAARSAYLPTISATYNYSGNGTNQTFRFVDERYAYSNSLRFNLQLPIFNQLQREEGIVRANVAADNAEAQLRDARLLAQQSLAQFLGQLQTSAQQVAIQEAAIAAATEDLRVQQQRYELGASTLLDVLTSQTQLNQARVALIQARYQARTARAQIEALIGRDLR